MVEVFQVPEKLRAMLDLLERQQDTLTTMLARDEKLRAGGQTWAYDGKLNKSIAELAGAYSTLAREYRNWLGHIKTNLDSLTLGRKMQVMVQFAQDLPVGNRRDLYSVLAGLESKRPDGFEITITDKFAKSSPEDPNDAA